MSTQPRRSPPRTDIRRRDLADSYVGLRLPAHLIEQIDAIARRESNGKSSVVRRLLTQALANEREEV